MNSSLTIDKIIKIENINHSDDHVIFFRGGSITFNPTEGPVSFWHQDDLIVLNNLHDLVRLKTRLKPRNPGMMQVDHTITEFNVTVRHMNNVGVETIKNLIQTKHEVLNVEELERSHFGFRHQ